MFHINNNGDAKTCRAKIPENCRFFQNDNDTRHYETVEEATLAAEKIMKEENPEEKLTKNVNYSFMKTFREQEKKFDENYDGIPNRFFNADLRGKQLAGRYGILENVEELTDETIDKIVEEEKLQRYLRFKTDKAFQSLTNSVSSPKDYEIDEKEMINKLKELGVTELKKVDDEKLAKNYKSDTVWSAKIDDKLILITSHNAGSKLYGLYRNRRSIAPFGSNTYFVLDKRSIAGMTRLKKLTGDNIMQTMNDTVISKHSYMRAQKPYLQILKKVEDKQSEGKNFINQKKYIDEKDKKIAGVFDDKKNPDKIHQNLMKNNTLNKYFKKIEIDNDVSPEEFNKFAQDYEKVKEKLPKIPGGIEPTLRIKKLGKHSSKNFKVSGLYSLNRNAVAIDVRDSGSFIHEMGHQYDLAVKNNASLSNDFKNIVKEYSQTIKMPAGSENKKDYYDTPTEIFSRFFENYAHDKLGVKDSKLLDTSKFTNFDHAPIRENEELRNKAYAFFDKIMKNDNN